MSSLVDQIELVPARSYCTRCPNCADFRTKSHVKSLMVYNDPDGFTRFTCMHPGCPWNERQWMRTPDHLARTVPDKIEEVLKPLPIETQLPEFDDIGHRIWWYRDAEGCGLFGAMRIDIGKDKIYVPVSFDHERVIRLKHWPRMDIFFNHHRVSCQKLLVCEGEKDTEAAQLLFPNSGCISWRGGAKNINTAPWKMLTGKTIYLWPDNDADGTGFAAMKLIADKLLDRNEVYMVNTLIFPTKKGGLADNLPQFQIGLALKGATKL